MSRPVCVHCGKPYGNRVLEHQNLKWPLGEDRPPYKSNGIVVKEGEVHRTPAREDVRAHTMISVNPTVRAHQEADLEKIPLQGFNTSWRDIWDGESYQGGYKPFCTLRCALDYARKAYAKTKRK